MATRISNSPEDTFAIGAEWGREAQPGWVFALSGDLGAGKTQLVKGFAQGLGSTSRVHSPTFALLNEYTGGRCRLFHLDLYRLNSPSDVVAAGLDEYLSTPDGITVVEWPERWFAERTPRPGLLRWAKLETLSDSQRRITYEDSRA
jgi:tRNA threonylcarbamoyladenosine biosynthesis protein TsaE